MKVHLNTTWNFFRDHFLSNEIIKQITAQTGLKLHIQMEKANKRTILIQQEILKCMDKKVKALAKRLFQVISPENENNILPSEVLK